MQRAIDEYPAGTIEDVQPREECLFESEKQGR
jgi:hypothetical protein